MAGYSIDLRERVLADFDAGMGTMRLRGSIECRHGCLSRRWRIKATTTEVGTELRVDADPTAACFADL
jgi:hypothetical protein